ncbi:kinase-like protein [Ascobolus immersus RN42]|uniref:cyclin-dependent kinase n=1 Tax=Ascobolus immersus RN42 TaxID=1160509 RepID=A0A3N4I1G2_ASCIM|nr:kinase-like protein [Ascobolus immersus RN42]
MGRWDNVEEDPEEVARIKAEKEAKKRAKAEKKAREAAAALAAQQAASQATPPPSKRRRLDTPSAQDDDEEESRPKPKIRHLRFEGPVMTPSRSVDEYEPLNQIEEGSYGIVSRAKEIATGEIYALKKIKFTIGGQGEAGFPLTSLREIQVLMRGSEHRNLVGLKEMVVGESLDSVYIVMPFLPHDLKALLDTMPEPFLPSEIKTLVLQLASGVAYLHKHSILHRDLKTSNLLLSNTGQLQIADFGLARYTPTDGSEMTAPHMIVTLWYRSPELLLGDKNYGKPLDMWSVGCIFGELFWKDAILQGKTAVDQMMKIIDLCGPPSEENWPGFKRLANARALKLQKPITSTKQMLRPKFPLLTNAGMEVLAGLLTLDPSQRMTAEEVLVHPYFKEDPRPKAEELLPTFPSKANQERRRRHSPGAPVRGEEGDKEVWKGDLFGAVEEEEVGAGFQLKMGR